MITKKQISETVQLVFVVAIALIMITIGVSWMLASSVFEAWDLVVFWGARTVGAAIVVGGMLLIYKAVEAYFKSG